jgi:hypothetical protein
VLGGRQPRPLRLLRAPVQKPPQLRAELKKALVLEKALVIGGGQIAVHDLAVHGLSVAYGNIVLR